MAQQTQRILVSFGGSEDTFPTTITKDYPPVDLTAATITLSLGTLNAPGSWVTPDTDVTGANAAGQRVGVLNQRIVTMRVNNTVPLGTYYLWVRVIDGSQDVIRISGEIVVS